MTDTTKQPATPLHPTLHFEPRLTSVGVFDAAGKLALITCLPGELPAHVKPQLTSGGRWQAGGRPLHPAPALYARLNGRWDASDVAAFCKDGTAPSFAAFLARLRDELLQLVEFTRPETAALVACWIAGTYFFPLFTTFPRLNLNGRKQAGKSKTLQVIAATAFNGLHLVIPTAATLFRLIEPLRPTFCLDEMEKLDNSEQGAIGAILNAGYKAGIGVPRTEEHKGERVVRDYDAYAPVALASIKGVNLVLGDRAITVTMQRGRDKRRVNAEVDTQDPRFSAIRAMGYRLALTGGLTVRRALDAVRAQPDSFTTLAGRPLELYRPLIALATIASAEGDPSFLAALSALVRDDIESQERLDPDTALLFAALETRLRAAPTITVYPGQLLTDENGLWLPGGPVGKLLQQHGFPPGTRTKLGQPYTITREQLVGQARAHGYPLEEETGGSRLLPPDSCRVPEAGAV
jgi:hypothetical protein